MTSTWFEVKKFNGKWDFSMWKKKIKASLVQQKVAPAIGKESEYPKSWKEEIWREKLDTAFSTVILHLVDNVLRQVDGEESAAAIWTKLDKRYMSQSLSNKIYLTERLFGFKMDMNKNLEENLDDFMKITLSLANTGEKISDENQAIILLNSMPETYREVKSAIKYGRTSLTVDEVLEALKTRDLEIKTEKKSNGNGESLNVRGRMDKKDTIYKGKGRSKSHNSGRVLKCFHCHKEGHFKRNCTERKQLRKEREKTDPEVAVAEKEYDSAYVLVVATKTIEKQWILDSGCTFHMTPNRS